jgi:hypothetical protein
MRVDRDENSRFQARVGTFLVCYRRWALSTAATVLFGAALTWAVTTAKAPAPQLADDQQPGQRFNQASQQGGEALGVPRIVVDELDHDLGVIDSSAQCAHTFLVRNEGTAPLLLRRGSTTCKCTMSELPSHPIPPGGCAAVRVASKIRDDAAEFFSDDKKGVFSHGATIFTNDPDQPAVTLSIQGAIRACLRAEPPRIVFSQLGRGESRSGCVLVYSQVWDAFAISSVRSSCIGLTWQIEPATRGSLDERGARSGYHLRVTVLPDLPGGPFREWLQLSIQPAGESDSLRSLKLDVVGEVARSVSVYGPRLCGGDTVRLGAIQAGTGAREQLLMKIRDEHRELAVQRIETKPDFLRVRVSPHGPKAAKIGLYRIEIEVPRDAPEGTFMAGNSGGIRIETNHPKLPVLSLHVEFAVVKP